MQAQDGRALWRAALVWTLLCGGGASDNCTSRRCLANDLVNRKLITQPQSDNCSEYIYVSSIEYQTIKVDTKNLRLGCRLQATIVSNETRGSKWSDVEPMVRSAVNSDRTRRNGQITICTGTRPFTPMRSISSSTQNSFRDLIVFSNGTLRHRVVMAAEVNCEFNLFNYPFAEDECPVAIQTWSAQGCGTFMEIGEVEVYDGSHGDWETLGAYLESPSDEQFYISVILKIRQQNPFITLMLPSILLILADMLPGDSECTPVIKNHFCVCLVLLVVSMLVSMVLTRVANDGGLIFCCSSGRAKAGDGQRRADQDDKADVSVIRLDNSEEQQMHRKVMDFLDAIKAKEAECERNKALADRIDKTFFWFYFILGTLYFCAMIVVMVKYKCEVDHLDFW
ncbi:uncharacterized protein [Syngnathus scovelli]|uniref:uncharacterized protein isoform X3 n=1 Tax=Syngnathus scovelli TaxID=161590 RepID=UPI00211032A5|nr:uncharacterized protein LOC125983481 isoform X3 [Syngnathus scovelli]